MSQSVLCPVLIGRAGELALLEEQLRPATKGTGRAVLITGDAGIGRSRLVAELVTRAEAGGAQVLTGVCAEGELTASFLPFVEAIGNHLAVPDDPAAVGATSSRPCCGAWWVGWRPLRPMPRKRPPGSSMPITSSAGEATSGSPRAST